MTTPNPTPYPTTNPTTYPAPLATQYPLINSVSTLGIVGTDGITPVYDPAARWCVWEINEIYFGNLGCKRYVPKVGDYVKDSVLNADYIVASIDPVTLIPTLRAIAVLDTGSMSKDDILFGVGPGTQADTYRVYLDTSVLPYVLAVDARLYVGGSATSYCKIFRGADVSDQSKVISALFDQSGTLLTLNIPLELARFDNNTNVCTKVVTVCHTKEIMSDGEIVTIVFYNDLGHVVSKRQLLVENTAFIRSINASQKYITGISIQTPFLSATSDTTIQFPINVPLQGIGLIGVVNYSDGSSLKMPVDGTKFNIFGLEQFVGTIVGQQISLVLSYAIGSDETAYGAVNVNNNKFVTKTLTLVATAQDNSYAVKLFGYPVWIDNIRGYKMSWFLYTLDRNITYNVTNLVRFNTNTGPFQPNAYGLLQNLSVSINLRDISGSFKSYIHVQSIGIVLAQQGDARVTNWTIGFDPLQNPQYGIGLHADVTVINANLNNIKIDSGITVFEDWLKRTYFDTKPIYNTFRELAPPRPNLFVLRIGGHSLEYDITSWNKTLVANFPVTINDTMFVEFILRTPSSDLKLGVSGLPIYDHI